MSMRRLTTGRGSLLKKTIFSAAILLISACTVAAADKWYSGFRITQEGDSYKLNKDESVRFAIVESGVQKLQIRIKDATKDLSFARCFDVKQDGSDFAGWFEKECRDLQSYDGTPVTYEYFVAGAYAGMSPQISAGYSMYDKLKEVAGSVGLAVPERTFVIYGSDRKPIYEFFCYPEDSDVKR